MSEKTGIVDTLEERQPYITRKQEKGQEIPLACDNNSLAGAISQRACVYSGARVVLNPVTDAVHLVHGPIGCAGYTWDIRGAKSSGVETNRSSFSTDMKEIDVVFGGEKKLSNAIDELAGIYRPPVIFVYSTCIVGIIGDDLEAVCKTASKKHNIPVIPVKSEGFKGNKSDGYKAACDALKQLIKRPEEKKPEEIPEVNRPKINILGDFNVAGDVWLVKPLFEKMGIEVIVSMTGDSTAESISRAAEADLNLVQCSGSMTYLAKWMQQEYGIPYQTVSFFGIEDISIALRKTAEYFGSEEMKKIAEEILKVETNRIMPEISRVRESVKGKKAAIYMGGPAKALTLIKGFAELGMEVVIIGTQTGKKEDYEQISYSVRDGTVIVDDANPLELAELLVKQKADLMVAGVKERFIAYKLGIAFCDFNHDRVVEFEGFDGFVNFAKEVDASINSPVWKAVRQRILKPGSMESEKAIVEKQISEKPHVEECKGIALKREFLHSESDATVESEI
ncbi:nitrogenase iron-molybdenum cofactor biosynthesis protein NifE [Methanosarcina mazei]|jgi:nitrogenase molybdenum-cofactor synthesis protein NifE|nr:nitrogenase iron-molybdenum cofactor biosynthesis protein NifE [Methanosarcina mazei]KKF99364.1 nitrogenase iron-molybdenum cofactor biosynthesis protein NifE [Methanosarcina mazei]KKG00370.1 nitrogenase iron-molybdenum cofactor biosynthesis protein NifE [Methanosarcina mazei]KKG06682.1 nitrogenase iron-molybdenum cofactor biosynthesis protein NifE [Methanosarcina mazei]KKG16132.1 nitrogenase iron-molybdenum cofactor biosynthesis protein NifE [Methanosarcina mazei]KKG34234.1 nitrogenase iro